MIKYLKALLGDDNVILEANKNIVLPLYLKNYEYNIVSLYGQEYVFVKPYGKINLKTYKAQKEKIGGYYGCLPVLVLEQSNPAQRRNLIANKIMFVEKGKQLFMPLCGIVLKDERSSVSALTEKFTPQIQVCALFFLYNRGKQYTVKQIAKKTNLNEMAISRGMNALEELKLVASESRGRTKYYTLCENEMCYLEKIEQYAISPVSKYVWVSREKKPNDVIRAGYSALSDFSMLLDNEYKTFAISKEEYKNIEKSVEITFEDIFDEKDYVKLEVWKYNPLLFAEKDVVDKFSLYMSMRETQDERTEAILKEIKESILNG